MKGPDKDLGRCEGTRSSGGSQKRLGLQAQHGENLTEHTVALARLEHQERRQEGLMKTAKMSSESGKGESWRIHEPTKWKWAY